MIQRPFWDLFQQYIEAPSAEELAEYGVPRNTLLGVVPKPFAAWLVTWIEVFWAAKLERSGGWKDKVVMGRSSTSLWFVWLSEDAGVARLDSFLSDPDRFRSAFLHELDRMGRAGEQGLTGKFKEC